jgi:hypothetical protein
MVINGLIVILTTTFILTILKLLKIILWSWLIVLMPIWITSLIIFGSLIIVFIFLLCLERITELDEISNESFDDKIDN